MNKHISKLKFMISNSMILILVIITTYLFRDDPSIVKKVLMWYACLLACVNLFLFYKKKTLPLILVICIVVWSGLGIIMMAFFSFMTINIYIIMLIVIYFFVCFLLFVFILFYKMQ